MIELPGCQGAQELDLDVAPRMLTLDSQAPHEYHLALPLPHTVDHVS